MLEQSILKTVRYFRQFKYAPTVGEIHTFLNRKTSRRRLLASLASLVKKKKLQNSLDRYTLGGYSTLFMRIPRAIRIAQQKEKRITIYIKLLSFFPQIQLVGLSGSVAMSSADKSDDIDLFIITAPSRLWTGRCICLFLATITGLRRNRTARFAPDKVCLNLFFDGSDLSLPSHKHTEYGAHEVLQMRPLINKKRVYERFLAANQWVFRIFPNAKNSLSKNIKVPNKTIKLHKNEKSAIETLLKSVQLSFIRRHRTTEYLTETQLWFFPEDFEKQMKKAKRQK